MNYRTVARVFSSSFIFAAALHVNAATLDVGEKAPDFEVTTLTGETFKLSDYEGRKPVYLKFWATWCSYCKVEMPHLQAVEDQYGEDVEVLAVNVGINDSVANIEQFFEQGQFNLPVVIDHQGDLTSRYGIVGTPSHVLIDKHGKVAYRTFLATDELDERIERWSAEQLAENKKKEIRARRR